MGIPALEDGLFVSLLIFDYLYIEIGGAGYYRVDRESCSYELNLFAVARKSLGVELYPAAGRGLGSESTQ